MSNQKLRAPYSHGWLTVIVNMLAGSMVHLCGCKNNSGSNEEADQSNGTQSDDKGNEVANLTANWPTIQTPFLIEFGI